ncbi:MAG: hypothetical protein GF330_01880 [Candidatus Eisenbacteria bacterium]|nr:hypothetical protein [Candidatus Eisenbacteria bacterium]
MRSGSRPRMLEVSGAIEEDTIWDADTVRLVGDVMVTDGTTLTVTPGVRIEAAGHHALQIQGTLAACGTPAAPILLTSADPSGFAIDSTSAGAWFGLRFDHPRATNDSSRLEYCILEYCKAAGDSSRGAALSLRGGVKLRVANCIFRHNVADYGAVAYCDQFAAPLLCSSLLWDNHAFVGGSAVYCLDAYPQLIHNTIAQNPVHNDDLFYATACIHNHISKARVTGCILWSNPSAYFLGGQIREGKFYYVTYSDIEDGHAGDGNLDADPLFVDQGAHPFALRAESPCVEAGRPETAGLGLPAEDLVGTPRIWLERIDIGAYEWALPAAVRDPDPSAAVATCGSLQLRPNPTAGAALIWARHPPVGGQPLRIYDAAGRLVRTLAAPAAPDGTVRVSWDGRDEQGRPAPAGIYHCVIASAAATTRGRLIRLR